MSSSVPNTQLLQEWVSSHLEYISGFEFWPNLQRLYEEYALAKFAKYVVTTFGIQEVLRYLQKMASMNNIGLVKRYCLLRAIQEAPLDKTNLELVIYCGDKEVVLKNVQSSDGESLQIEICIHCKSTPEDMDPNGGTKIPVNAKIKVEISDPLKGKETYVRTSRRMIPPTQGLRNRQSTCYGICVIHMLVYLMQLYISLEGNYMLKKLRHLKLNEEDQIEDSTSLSITEDVVALMIKKLDIRHVRCNQKTGERQSLKTQQQSSQEFLLFLIEEDCEDQEALAHTPTLHDLLSFEVVYRRQYECGECRTVRIDDNSSLIELQMLIGLGHWDEDTVVDFELAMKWYVEKSKEDRSIAKESERCDLCKTYHIVNPNCSSGGLCEHRYDPCRGCGKHLLSSESSRVLKTAPKVLWINYDRSTSEGTGRHQHCIEVDSNIRLDTDVGAQLYQIGGIICHQSESSENGHYVTYTRHKGVWRLHDDSKVRLIKDEDIVTEVKSREVVMCFYIQDGSDKSCEMVRIGSDELLTGSKVSTRSKKRAKLSHNDNSTA
jgi:ubiquitin C-terminal hydrolase